MSAVLIIFALLFILLNIVAFVSGKTFGKTYFDWRLFGQLFVCLLVVLFGFAIIYYLLSLNQVILVYSLSSMTPVETTWANLIYFSGVTLLSIGYGDMFPIGITRLFAILEATLGLLLPTAYFVKSLFKQ